MNTVIRNVNSVLFLWFGAVKRGNDTAIPLQLLSWVGHGNFYST